MEIKTFGKVKKGLAILLAVLFVVSMTAAAASACGVDNSYKNSCKDKYTSCAKDNGSCKNGSCKDNNCKDNGSCKNSSCKDKYNKCKKCSSCDKHKKYHKYSKCSKSKKCSTC